MALFLDIHPQNPQPRTVRQVVDALRDGALIAYPTSSGFALGCALGNAEGKERMVRIRHLDAKHDFTLVCEDFAQLGQLVQLNNAAFRAIKASTPGPYTFILPATAEVPRKLVHPKKKTVGVRLDDHPIARAPSSRSWASRCCRRRSFCPTRTSRSPTAGPSRTHSTTRSTSSSMPMLSLIHI